MKTKLISLLFAIVASIGTMFASVIIDGIAYNLNETELTAEVTSGGNYSGSVIIPDSIIYETNTYSVTRIENEAFRNCSSLTSVTIGNGVTSIGYGAFWGCSSLTSVTIPSSVTSIAIDSEHGVFWNSSGLTSISIAAGNTVYDSRENCNAIIETASNRLVAGCQNAVIPNSVTSIGNAAFRTCYNLTSIEIPEEITSIEDYAFYYCSSLTSVTIPNSVVSVGENAFCRCDNLSHLTLGTSIRSEEIDYLMGHYSFFNCCYDDITIYNTIPPQASIGTGACFPADMRMSTLVVYVPGSAVRTYKDHGIWGRFNIQPIPGTEIAGKEIDVRYCDEYEEDINHEYIIFTFPDAPEIPGYSFIGWQPVCAIIEDELKLQAVYEYTDVYTSVAPIEVVNPANPTQKLIREGDVYILHDGKTYTTTGAKAE